MSHSPTNALGVKICETLGLPADLVIRARIEIDFNDLPTVTITMIDPDGKLANMDWSEVACGNLKVWIKDASEENLH